MDFVSRLKQYLEIKQIPVTQFADTCRIPRPTLSQLLNGRNKKVSDEVIGKIHEAYPDISVMWLMFGEGSMTSDTNIEFSRPENYVNNHSSATQPVDNKPIATQLNFDDVFSENSSENFTPSPAAVPTPLDEMPPSISDSHDPDSEIQTISFNSPDRHRTVVNIIVYYSDNSFQNFVPAGFGKK